jgi:hypothetical protein
MKKAIWLIAVPLLLTMLVFFAGCGGSTKATGNTKAQGSTGELSEAALGVPIYPGATRQQSAAGRPVPPAGSSTPRDNGTRPDFNGPGSTPRSAFRPLATLWTPDSTDKVASWYREKLKGKTGFKETTMPAGSNFGGTAAPAIFSFKSGDTTRVVMIRASFQNQGGTTITVRNSNGELPSVPRFNQGQQSST